MQLQLYLSPSIRRKPPRLARRSNASQTLIIVGVDMKVFFDSNAGDPESGFILWFPQSIKAINRLPGGPQEGVEVELCMPDELRCRGRLIYDDELGYWRAVPVAGTMEIIDGAG